MTTSTPTYAHRHHVAAEILELGETLFDAVLDAAAARSGAVEGEPLPEAELRTAAEEFFKTLRVMLGLPKGSAQDGLVPGEAQVSSSGTSTDST
jgi:hypothetical protein